MPEKPMSRPMEIPAGRPVEEPDDVGRPSQPISPEMTENLPEPTPEEESQVDMLLGSLLDFVWGDGYEAIVERMQANPTGLQQTIGEWVGQMVNVEVQSASEGGVDVSRDILIGVADELINNIAEIAVKEGLWNPANDQEQEQFQGEALMFAIQHYGEMGDEGLNPEGMMQNAVSILRDEYPEEEMAAKLGRRADEEVLIDG